MSAKSKSREPEQQEGIIITKLYGGEIIAKFYERSHQYWMSTDGKKFKRSYGATTPIGIKDKSRALGIWQQQTCLDYLLTQIAKGVKIDEDVAAEAVIAHEIQRDTAADIGKEIHAYCEAFIKHDMGVKGFEKMPPMPDFPEAISGVNAFMAWLEAHKVKFYSTERILYSKKHGYMGTMDFEARIDGKRCVGDFKSSAGLYNSVRMQTAAYAMAHMEESGVKIEGRWAVRLNKLTEKEYMAKERRKVEIKQAIARVKGQAGSSTFIKPYQVFEAVPLDTDPRNMQHDFDAFLSCCKLQAWDRATDTFNNGGSLEYTNYGE